MNMTEDKYHDALTIMDLFIPQRSEWTSDQILAQGLQDNKLLIQK